MQVSTYYDEFTTSNLTVSEIMGEMLTMMDKMRLVRKMMEERPDVAMKDMGKMMKTMSELMEKMAEMMARVRE